MKATAPAPLPDAPTLDDLHDHVVELCEGACVGDPQLLADLDDLTYEELLNHINDTHAYYASKA